MKTGTGMKNKKLITTIAFLLAMCLMFCGCSLLEFGIADLSETDEEDGSGSTDTVVDTYVADDVFSLNCDMNSSINPLTSSSELNLMFSFLIYESLFDVDESLNVTQSRLVTEYSSSDGIHWYFTISASVAMHDGTMLTAQDVAYSINRARTSTLYSDRLQIISGCSASEDVMSITLSRVNMQLPALLNIPIIKDGSIEEAIPAGSGPYVVNDSRSALELFVSHPDASSMPLEQIYLVKYETAEDKITAFEDSIIDLVLNDPNSLSDLGYGSANTVRGFATTSMHYIGFNQNSSIMQYAGARHAVTYAIDRETITANLMGGSAVSATLPISPMSNLYNANFAARYDYDLDKCLTVLKNTGIEDLDYDGMLEHLVASVPAEISIDFIVNSDSAGKVAAARKITEALCGIGLDVTLRELSWEDYVSALAQGDFDMYYAEVRLTADFDLTRLLSSSGALNYGDVSDAALDTYIAEYLAATDEERTQRVEVMYQYIMDTSPIAVICFEKQELVMHRGVISGTTPTQYNVFNSFTDWTIKLD